VQFSTRRGLPLNPSLGFQTAPRPIASGYRGEICIILENTSPESYADAPVLFATDKGNKKGPYQIKKGDRIAQMVFARYETAELVMTSSVDTIGIDRKGGFGSTGV
jgi:dUTP pyrophosphatase